MGDVLCVPQDLRHRGVAVIRPGEGRKLAGLGGDGRDTQGGRGGSSTRRSEGGLFSSRGAREVEEGAFKGGEEG